MERQNSSLFAVHFPALASRDYVLFVTGQLISLIGTWMQSTALPYLAHRMTGCPEWGANRGHLAGTTCLLGIILIRFTPGTGRISLA